MLINETDAGAPAHVGIIMDGNGRWAERRNLPRTAGHKEGLSTAKRILAAARKIGVRYVTLYAFSTENWKRTVEEVGYLMSLIKTHLRKEFEFYRQNGIRIKYAGNMEILSTDIANEIIEAEKSTERFGDLTVILAINYGGRDEIVRAVKKIPSEKISALTEADVGAYLDNPEIPPPDLIIRTGGEKRLSNFLIWQSAYSELFFDDALWPDWDEDHLYNAVADFKRRNRRFGGTS